MSVEQISPTVTPDITVMGDIILDRYWHATVLRTNPEAPGVVCNVASATSSLGGCGAVAAICQGLGLAVSVGCAVAPDREGDEVVDMLCQVADGGGVILATMPQTTMKQRVIANGQLMHTRFDFEEVAEVDKLTSRHLLLLPIGKVILVSDYGKGFCSDAVLRRIFRIGKRAGVPVIVDPARGRCPLAYRGATVLKLNASEARHITGQDPAQSAEWLSTFLECAVIVTDGSEGMFFSHAGEHWHQQAVPSRVVDVTGAGDTVLAAVGLGFVRSLGWKKTMSLAAELAAQQVGIHGVAPVKEMTNENRV